ncbi:hypothetical protein ACFSJM_04060 [Lactococcus formosensis subsp. bovis]
MDYFTSILEFFGAWFLFGAPLFQSVTELYEELDKREKLIREIYSHNFEEHVKSISFWWWLFPPLKILLEKIEIKRIKKITDEYITQYTRQKLHRLSVKVNGWSGVTIGAWFIALSTTWEFVKLVHLSLFYWWMFVFGGTYISIFLVIKIFRYKNKRN